MGDVSTQDTESSPRDEFVALFSRHSRRIYSFIVTLVVHHQDADEVFQNTSMALWKKHNDFAPGTSFWAWACQIVYYEVLRFREKSSRTKVFSDDLIPQLAANLLAREEQVTMLEQSLRHCLEQLNAADRRMIEMRYFHEQAPKQIAQLQSRSVHSIYRALSRIHERLHRCIHRVVAGEGGA